MSIIAIAVFLIALSITLGKLIKKEPEKRNSLLSGILIALGAIAFCVLVTWGFILLLFMSGGFLESHGPPAGTVFIQFTAYFLMIFAACGIIIAGFSAIAEIGKNKKPILIFTAVCVLAPALQFAILEAGSEFGNISLPGFFKYLSVKKFTIGGLRWGMQETADDKNYRYGYIPGSEMCGHQGKILFKRFNYNNKLYRLETFYNTKTKKEQDDIVECMKSRFGKPYQDKSHLPMGGYVYRWHAPDTDVEMVVHDEGMTGAINTPPYSMVAVDYQFAPSYLHDKTGAAFKGY